MKTFHAVEAQIQVIVRAILVQGEKIVLCWVKGSDRFFLPGGHVENGELAQAALVRELEEELGIIEYESMTFVGVCEGMFPRDRVGDIWEQQINLVFEVKIPEGEIVSQEDHIEFIVVDRSMLDEYVIMPVSMRSGIVEWFETKKPFFTSFEE